MKDFKCQDPKFFLVLPGNKESLQAVCGANVIMKVEIVLKVETTGVIDIIEENVSSCRTHIRCWGGYPYEW